MSEIIMPKVGDAMTEGKVVRWYKSAGDAVKSGEPIAEIETDKVNMDLEAEETGVLEDVRVEAGAMVEVGGILAMIRKDGEAPAPRAEKKTANPPEVRVVQPEPAAVAAAAPKETASAAKPEPGPTDGRMKSSPLARKMAGEMGVDLGALAGSGPAGRIIAADVEQAAKSSGAQPRPPAASKAPATPARQIEGRDVPLTPMRRTIAKRLAESLGPVPHFFLTIEADVTALLATREQLNEIHSAKVSINDFVIRACALALLEHPMVNASFGSDAIRQHGEVHVGIAVATPEGLITPVVRNADRKSVLEIAGEVRSLAERARNRKLMPEDYQGSTFTISNLGMFGIEEFTAIINPPNSAIVAVGAAMAKPVAVERQVVVRDRMRLTMSCDHRVIDGAAGAQFLQTLQRLIEQPLRLVM